MNVRLCIGLALSSLSAMLFCAVPAGAQLINGSFEGGTFTGANPQGVPHASQLQAGDTSITGWTAVNELSWDETGNTYGLDGSNGNRWLDLTGYHDSQPEGGVQQGLTLLPGTTYRLGFDVGYSPNFPTAPDGVTVTIAQAGISQTFNNDNTGVGVTVGNTFWKTFTLDFTPTVAGNTLLLQGSSASSGAFIGLDNVTLTPRATATPEPGSLALLATGGLSGIAFLRRRRVRK